MKDLKIQSANSYAVPSARTVRERAQSIVHSSAKGNDTKDGKVTQLSQAALVTSSY